MDKALSAVRTPEIDAPVGSYVGTSPYNPGALRSLAGLCVPFDAATPRQAVSLARGVRRPGNRVGESGGGRRIHVAVDGQTRINEASASSIGKVGTEDHAEHVQA